MPELPEVETVRRSLEQQIVGKTIDHVTVRLARIIQLPKEPSRFAEQLQNCTISKIGRRGKFLKIYCYPWVLVSHLRMEGKYRVHQKDEPLEKHTHVLFHFTDGQQLRYLDVRQFGTMHLFPAGEEDLHPPLNKLGVEPLAEQFTLTWLQEAIAKRRTKLKALLLNQSFIAGLGNIYVDEVLFQAGLHPEQVANQLNASEIERLYHAIRQILQRALEAGGSSVRTYVDGAGRSGDFQNQHRVYGRKNEPCFVCTSPIERIVVAGRGTHLCPSCQTIH